MEQTELLPLNLQLFAEEAADETSEVGSETETETNEEEQQEQSTDNDKIVEKLQKRIGKEQAEDDEIASLKAQIKISNITSQADEVLKESGIALSAAELGLLVDVDEEKTYSNVKTFLN